MKPFAGPGRHAERAREPLVAQLAQRLPDLGRLEPAAVGVVQQQQVEGVGAAALEAALGGHAQVVAVLVRAAQARVGEAREALRALALALVEVVADRADERVVVARHAGQRAAEQRVGLARAVGVGRDHRVDAVAGPQQRLEALVRDRLAEAHEAPAAPGADCYVTEHAFTLWSGRWNSMPLAPWAALIVALVFFLWLDLHFFARGREPSFKEAAWWSVGWLALSLAAAIPVLLLEGANDAITYTTVYLIERSLSLDNLFVFLLLFAYFGVPYEYRPRLLFFGIVAALALRGAFILGGTALIEQFHS